MTGKATDSGCSFRPGCSVSAVNRLGPGFATASPGSTKAGEYSSRKSSASEAGAVGDKAIDRLTTEVARELRRGDRVSGNHAAGSRTPHQRSGSAFATGAPPAGGPRWWIRAVEPKPPIAPCHNQRVGRHAARLRVDPQSESIAEQCSQHRGQPVLRRCRRARIASDLGDDVEAVDGDP
jgi:hypothetical protein